MSFCFTFLKTTYENLCNDFSIVECYAYNSMENNKSHRKSLALPFFGIGMKTDLFQSCGHCWVFQICWHIEYSTFTASSFRIWNCSTGMPSLPLALFVVMLPKVHLTSYSRVLLTPKDLVDQMVKNLPSMLETWVLSLGWEDPLEKGMATQSSILAWRILWGEEPDRLQSMGLQRVRQDWATNTTLPTLN